MANNDVSFAEMLEEIRELQNDKYVKLAMAESHLRRVVDANIKSLRQLQCRGMELEEAGVTFDLLERSNYDDTL